MELYGIEKLSLVDYDGVVACTVFTGLCNFNCGFCHNSPLVHGISNLPKLDNEEIFSYLKKRKGILEGVCVTGGEPTLNKDLPSFLEKLKDLGYLVKLDTNGTNPDMVKDIFKNKLADYFAIDIKNDKEHYGDIIGIPGYNTEKVEKTVDFLITNAKNYEFRTTAVKEFHQRDNFINIAKWINGANKYVIQKFIENDNCIKQGLSGIAFELASEYLKLVSPYVKQSKLRGY